mgnify:CR=1 FL=1
MKKITLIITSITLYLCTSPLTIKAQQNKNNIHSNSSYAEKIYLQLDKTTYLTGSTIWFKAIITDAVNHVPSSLSNVLYVELIDQNKKILQKKIIKIDNGIGQGFFDLDKTLTKGRYLIRGYTEWNKNFGTDFFFEKYIQIFNLKEKQTSPINNVTLIKEQTKENRIQASFDPLAIDSLHKKNLTVFITLDNKKDTVSLKKGKDGIYTIDYPIGNVSETVRLEIQTKNKKSYSKTIALNKEYLDLQFFPESGELVHGLNNTIGFKALGINGKGKIVHGEIIDEKGIVVTSFKSNILGMGSFVLNEVYDNKSYHARLITLSTEKEPTLYPLPKVASKGNIISMKKSGNNILLTASSNYLKNDNIYLRIATRGVTYITKKVRLKNGNYNLLVPRNLLPEGIISSTMMDNAMVPVAERLYFNIRPKNRIQIDIATDKKWYAKRDLTRLEIKTKDSIGKPIKANISMLVINKEQLGKTQSLRQNILSHLLLESELRGEIENPGFYFNENRNMHRYLDVLMLTQGWRKYRYSKPLKKLIYQPEKGLTVNGRVKGSVYSKKKEELVMTMMTFGKDKTIHRQTTDSLNNFTFNLDDEYGDDLKVTIQTADKSGKKKRYPISLHKKKSPSITFNQTKTLEEVDSVAQIFIEKNIEKNKIYKAYFGTELLNEVVLSAYVLAPNRKKTIERYGKPEVVIDGKEILAKQPEWSSKLFDVLHQKFPRARINFHNYRASRLITLGPSNLYVLFVVDGMPVTVQERIFVQNIPTSEVSSFEIIECMARNKDELYFDVYGRKIPDPLINECFSILFIYTHAGKGIAGTIKPAGITNLSVPIFSTLREFYTPKYKNSIDWSKPDLRTLVHWKPILKTDVLGKITTSYYNADNTGKMKVVVEAISENGEIGYKEIVYEVHE